MYPIRERASASKDKIRGEGRDKQTVEEMAKLGWELQSRSGKEVDKTTDSLRQKCALLSGRNTGFRALSRSNIFLF